MRQHLRSKLADRRQRRDAGGRRRIHSAAHQGPSLPRVILIQDSHCRVLGGDEVARRMAKGFEQAQRIVFQDQLLAQINERRQPPIRCEQRIHFP